MDEIQDMPVTIAEIDGEPLHAGVLRWNRDEFFFHQAEGINGLSAHDLTLIARMVETANELLQS